MGGFGLERPLAVDVHLVFDKYKRGERDIVKERLFFLNPVSLRKNKKGGGGKENERPTRAGSPRPSEYS